jgi:hypothetical protein
MRGNLGDKIGEDSNPVQTCMYVCFDMEYVYINDDKCCWGNEFDIDGA